MRQQTETNHMLQVRDREGLCFHPADAGMYQEARKLADRGMLQQALEKACDIRIQEYGNMHGVSFRIVSTIKMVTVLGDWNDAR